MAPKFPDVTVVIYGATSPFTVMGRTITALREAGVDEAQITQYVDDAAFGDYQHLLDVTRLTVTVKE